MVIHEGLGEDRMCDGMPIPAQLEPELLRGLTLGLQCLEALLSFSQVHS